MFNKAFTDELYTELDHKVDEVAKKWSDKYQMTYIDLVVVLRLLAVKSDDINVKAITEAMVESYAHLDEKKPKGTQYG